MIGFPGVPVAVVIGVTVSALQSATYTVFPSGLTAIAVVPLATLIGLPGILVIVEIGVTEPILLTCLEKKVTPLRPK